MSGASPTCCGKYSWLKVLQAWSPVLSRGDMNEHCVAQKRSYSGETVNQCGVFPSAIRHSPRPAPRQVPFSSAHRSLSGCLLGMVSACSSRSSAVSLLCLAVCLCTRTCVRVCVWGLFAGNACPFFWCCMPIPLCIDGRREEATPRRGPRSLKAPTTLVKSLAVGRLATIIGARLLC